MSFLLACCWGEMSHVFQSPNWGSPWKWCWVRVVTSSVDSGRERPGVPGRVALGAKFLSWLDHPSALGPLPSAPDPPGPPLYSSAGGIMGEVYLKGHVFWGMSVLVCTAQLTLLSQLPFVLDFPVWNTVEAQKWEKGPLSLLLWGIVNLRIKTLFLWAFPLPRDIHTQTWLFFRGILRQNFPNMI